METQFDVRRAFPKAARIYDWCAPDGWTLRRMDWPQPDAAAARGSLLFAGGRGDFIEKYLEAYAHWHGRGWNVAAFDWRGQGRSRGDIVGGNVTSFDPLVADFDALIGDWRAAAAGPHVAVGHSMGGHLLLRTLVEKRPPLAAAVLVAPMIRVNSAPIPAVAAPAVASLMCLAGRRDRPILKQRGRKGSVPRRQHFLTGSAERYADELWWWEREPGYNLGLPSWGWMRASFRSAAAWFTPKRLASLEVPLLILGAERDRLVSAAAIRRAAALLPDAELRMYPDAAHEILRDADPVRDDALARIDAFFEARAR